MLSRARSVHIQRLLRPVLNGAVFVVGGLLLLSATGCQDTAGAAPQGLVVDQSTRDLGSLLPEQAAEVKFKLRNAGTEVLKISQLTTSCGCAPAKISSESIPPGGEATLTMSIRAPPHVGTFAHSASFDTTSPQLPHMRLFVSGKSEWPVDVSPKSIFVPTMRVGDAFRGEVKLFSLDRKPVQVQTVKSTSGRIQVESLTTAGHETVIPFVVESSTAGKITAAIEIGTGDVRRPVITVPVDVTINDDFAVLPRQLLLGPRSSKATVKRSFTVVMPRNIEIKSVSLSSAAWQLVNWQVKRLNERRSQLDVSLTVPAEDGYHRAELFVDCGGSEQRLSSRLSCFVSTMPGGDTSAKE